MQDELTAVGRERWQALADEAARERRAHAVAGIRRGSARERLAAVLIGLATRFSRAAVGTAAPGSPAA